MTAENRRNTLFFTSTVLLGIHNATLQSVLERMSADLGLSLTVAGSLVTMNFIGVLIGPLIAGETGDRSGRKPVALMAIAGYIAAVVVAALATGYAVLAGAILAAGVASSILESSVTGLISDGNSGRGAATLHYSQAWFSAGAAAGPFLTLPVLATSLGWRGTLGMMAALFTALMILFRRLPALPPADPPPRRPGSVSLELLGKGFFLLLCLSLFFYVGVESATAYWMDTYFIRILSQPALGKVALALFWGGTLVGRLLGGRFERRRNLLLTGGLALSATCMAAVPFTVAAWANVALFGLAGLGFSTVWPTLMARTAARYPQSRGAAIGLMMAASGVGGMLIPFFMGLVADARGMETAVWILPLATAALLALCLAVIGGERNRRSETA